MFLKSLEVRGFKSFADKTNLEFKSGITAVVGPNGSGKSNISDSVKWVLGEQSVKNLRGGKMEDVIFAGTQYRKPVGLAQVSLVLDNNDQSLPLDYNEVRISRRLYRSGESEYYINNTKCRLKDIHELFMDTGVGREGYSIIGQGKIEAILSGRPEERRSILEDAAGIVKYKTRKNDAEKKLESTMQNLQRVEDIFSTYEERIEPLRKESLKASQFIELSQKLKVKEINILIHDLSNIQNDMILCKEELWKIEISMKNLINENSTIKNKIEQNNIKLEDIEKENNFEKEQYFKNKEKTQDLIHENSLSEEKIKNNLENIEKYRSDVISISEKISFLVDEESRIQSFLQETGKNKKIIDDGVILLSEEILFFQNQISENEEEVKNKKDLIIEKLSDVSLYKNNINLIENNISNYKAKLEDMQLSYDTYKNTVKINSQTITMLENEVLKLNKDIQFLEEKIIEDKKIIFSEKKLLEETQKDLKLRTSEFNRLEAHHRMLIDLENNHEGYTKSTKDLMNAIDKNKIPSAFGKCRILGEIIDVDEKYESAIEIALGSAISNIITDDDSMAKNLIEYLKKENIGRATFLPLNTIKPNKIFVNENTKNAKGYIGVASDIIDYNPSYKKAIDYALGRILIADNLENASSIAKLNNFSFRIVTLQGDVINSGGSFTGGSIYKKSFNVISRKRKIDETESQKIKQNEDIEALNIKIEKIQNKIKAFDDECLDLRDKIHYKNIDITKINGKIIAVDKENEKLTKDLQISKKEMEAININIFKTYDDANIYKLKVEELSTIVEKDKELVEEIEKTLIIDNISLNTKKEEQTSLKIKQAHNEEVISNKKNELSRIKLDLNEFKKNHKKIENEIESSLNNKKLFEKNIEDNIIKIAVLEKKLITFKDKMEEKEVEKLKLKEIINSLLSSKEQHQDILSKQSKEEQKITIEIAKLETELEQKYSRLNEEYNLTYAEALEMKVDQMDIMEFKKDVKEYKSEIKALGVVNVGAVEEYKELSEKYIFLKQQKEDLLNAKDEIQSLIKDMTEKMKSMFKENFQKMRENFNETFIELFKGGHADLILGEGDELSANIDINVQPPGKKLQNINLMSGGEKGLSAIALLFAIQKMRPSPFCILDEIEAALDDANVKRFSEFLQKFSEKTQFIIITHRKGTMECSDALYGVTMEEKGVSKIVSVDLSKYE
ncbi:chromosome segregation protein SMC [Clostridium grantii]|uniref:Chromosome partition protein Smc n=1 Tax=Clostridium grantii DSM 8605 TaxID=1121316 RepID=A0A1M5QUW7_9CLOT|nr:chromosome segregation protein SMC [Clostridium grantii]SHH17915.1 condensin subunit Smc [Clostridium grantii DSM 8605]